MTYVGYAKTAHDLKVDYLDREDMDILTIEQCDDGMWYILYQMEA